MIAPVARSVGWPNGTRVLPCFSPVPFSPSPAGVTHRTEWRKRDPAQTRVRVPARLRFRCVLNLHSSAEGTDRSLQGLEDSPPWLTGRAAASDSSRSSSRRGRPIARPLRVPRSRARRSPATTRSRIRLRSNSAIAPSTWNRSRRRGSVHGLVDHHKVDTESLELAAKGNEFGEGCVRAGQAS